MAEPVGGQQGGHQVAHGDHVRLHHPLLDEGEDVGLVTGRHRASAGGIRLGTNAVPRRLRLEHQPVVEEALLPLQSPPGAGGDGLRQQPHQLLLGEVPEAGGGGVVTEVGDDGLRVAGVDHRHQAEGVVDHRVEQRGKGEYGEQQHGQQARLHHRSPPAALVEQPTELLLLGEGILDDQPVGGLHAHS